MLPRPLCEYLCSLIPNKDRLTFSVVWTLSDKGELLGEWIGRSIIRSKAKLSYDEAQQIIDYPKFHWQKSHFPTIADEQHVPVVVQSVITLNQIANTLRQLRQSNGCLKLDRPKLSFTIDEATGLPNGYYVHKPQESNR
jgi:DIS3-like exonuclease 2